MRSSTGTTSTAATWPTSEEARYGRTTLRIGRGYRMPTSLCGRGIKGTYGRTWRVRRRARCGRRCSRVSGSAIARFSAALHRRRIAGLSAAWTAVRPRGNMPTTVIRAWGLHAARLRRERLRRSGPLRHSGPLRPAGLREAADMAVVVEGEDDDDNPNFDGGRRAAGGDGPDPSRRANRSEDIQNSAGRGAGVD